MSRQSRLAASGGNLFQTIKLMCTEAEAKGQKLLRLSIGQPSGPAFHQARIAASDAVMSEAESMHEYQDNGSPGVPDFARMFCGHHMKGRDRVAILSVGLAEEYVKSHYGFLPIPGIKPMFMPIILACGASSSSPINVMTTTKPGYPTPADVCGYLGTAVKHNPIVLSPDNDFQFDPGNLLGADLAMINYPHNPSGQIASREWLHTVCEYCLRMGIRLFNDAAYAKLAGTSHIPLADVAAEYPDLSWAEAFSCSKLGNMTGWRIGAIIGSPDFVADIAKIKGNIDSGFAAPMAAGALELLQNGEEFISHRSDLYATRLKLLIETLQAQGMKLAVYPGAGFFSLWLVPKMAFGEEIKNAEHFNKLMIERTGVVGVHFDPYIRYSVAQTGIQSVLEQITSAFEKAKVSY